MASSLLNEASAAIGADLDSPVVNAAAIVLWAGVWWMVSAISLQWLTPRGLPAVPDEKRWHVRPSTNRALRRGRCADALRVALDWTPSGRGR
jgi:hypothetical protein